jgi:hypothetical protein
MVSFRISYYAPLRHSPVASLCYRQAAYFM